MTYEELAQQLQAAALGRSDKRIFCIVGPNGAGKSRLLSTIKARLLLGDDPVSSVILPASRDMFTPYEANHGMVQEDWLSKDTFEEISRAQRGLIDLRNTSGYFTVLGATGLLHYIIGKDNLNANQYRQDLLSWAEKEDCCNLNKPKKPASVRHSILGALSSIIKREVVCRADFQGEVLTSDSFGLQLPDRVLSLNELSDGERQAFLLAAFLLKAPSNSYACLIDEPELHLNDARANDLWSAIENHVGRSPFLYATHNMSFATRGEVDFLASIDMEGNLDVIEANSVMPPIIVRELLGARVRILRTKLPTIFCEDDLTKEFLTDVMAGVNVEIIALPGRGAVLDAAKQQAGWDHILPDPLPTCGVVDRDELDDDEVAHVEARKTIVLPFNEIESFFVDRDVFLIFARRNSLAGTDIEGAYEAIVDNAAKSLARRAIEKHKQRICRQFPFQVTIDHTIDEVRDVKIGSLEALRDKVKIRCEAILACRSAKDYSRINKMYPGKEMYAQFFDSVPKKMGFYIQRNSAVQYRQMRNDGDMFAQIMKLPHIVALRDKIKSVLGL